MVVWKEFIIVISNVLMLLILPIYYVLMNILHVPHNQYQMETDGVHTISSAEFNNFIYYSLLYEYYLNNVYSILSPDCGSNVTVDVLKIQILSSLVIILWTKC